MCFQKFWGGWGVISFSGFSLGDANASQKVEVAVIVGVIGVKDKCAQCSDTLARHCVHLQPGKDILCRTSNGGQRKEKRSKGRREGR